jgi:hypothetical protein
VFVSELEAIFEAIEAMDVCYSKGPSAGDEADSFPRDELEPRPGFRVVTENLSALIVSPVAQTQFTRSCADGLAARREAPHFYDILSVLLPVLRRFSRSDATVVIVRTLFDSPLFDPSYGLSALGSNLCLLLRNSVYRLLMTDLHACFAPVLTKLLRSPTILLELFGYFSDAVELFVPPFATTDHFLTILVKVTLGSHNFGRKLREVVFEFVMALLKNPEILYNYLQSDLFLPVFIAFGFEREWRRRVLDLYREAMFQQSDLTAFALPVVLNAVLSCKDGKSADEIDFCFQLMHVANELAGNYINLRKLELNFLQILSSVVFNLQQSDISELLLEEIIRFCSVLESIDERTASALCNALQRVYHKEPTLEFFNVLKFLLTSNSPDIMRPDAGIVVLCAFWNAPSAIVPVEYLFELCRHSRNNCMMCHRGHFDLYLLRYLDKMKSSDCQELMTASLNLVSTIAAVKSSTAVVCAFVSLLSSIKLTLLSPYHSLFIETLTNIAIRAKTTPSAILPASRDAFIGVTGLRADLFSQTFTIGFLLYCERPSDLYLLFLRDERDEGIGLSIDRMNTLILQVRTKRSEIPYPCPVSIPTCEWFGLQFAYNIVDSRTKTMTIGINERFYEPVQFEFETSGGGKLFCSIIKNLGDTGYYFHGFSIHACGTLLAYGEMAPDDIAMTGTNASNPAISACLVGAIPVHYDSFATVLVNLCSIDLLLPVFAQLAMTDQQLGPSYVRLIGSFLVLNDDVQARFAEGHGFSPVSFLLSSSDPSHLSYDLYREFALLFRSLSSLALQKHVFESILMNFDLWSKAPNDALVLIAGHWSRVLYPSFSPCSYELKPFASILFGLSHFFSYKSKFQSIVEIRAQVMGIVLSMLSAGVFTSADFQAIIGQCLQLDDPREISDMVVLLKFLLTTPNSPIVNRQSALTDLSELHLLLSSKNEEIILLTIDIFLLLYEIQYFDMLTLEEHVNRMLPFVPAECTLRLVQKIIPLLARHPEFLALLFFVLYSMDAASFLPLIVDTLKSEFIRTSIFIWGMMCFVKYQGEFGKYILRYFLSCEVDILDIFSCFDAISCLHELDVNAIRLYFCRVLYEFIQAPEGASFERPFIDIVLNYLLFHSPPRKRRSKSLVTPFLRHENFIEQLAEAMAVKPIAQFTIRHDDDGRWLDRELAIWCLNEIQDHAGYMNIAGVIAYFLIRDGTNASPLVNTRLLHPSVEALLSGARIPCNLWFDVISSKLLAFQEEVQTTSVTLIRTFKEYFGEVQRSAKRIFYPSGTKDLTLVSAEQAGLDSQHMENEKYECRKRWFQLWNQMAFDGGPWETAFAAEVRVRRWKRDGVMCSFGFPAKMKVNGSFDNHMYAALCRDSGSKAEAMFEWMKAQESQPEEALPPLLQLSSEAMKSYVSTNLHDDSRPSRVFDAIYRKIDAEKSCVFQIFRDRLQLIFHETKRTRTIVRTSVKKILYRSILHRPHGIEIFVRPTRSVLLVFRAANAFDILNFLGNYREWASVRIQTQPSPQFFKSRRFSDAWVERRISTFKYIITLNQLSGRSFNDATMYPVFP